MIARLPLPHRWLLALLLTTTTTLILTSIAMPASILISSMLSAILLATSAANLHLPRPLFILGQSIIGTVIAATVKSETITEFLLHWPLYITMVLTVLAISALLGYIVAKQNILPGTTAIWGISPGAAPMMILLSEQHNADPRLVAVMQYLRVVMVSLTAGVIAKIFSSPLPQTVQNTTANATWTNTLCTLAISLIGCVVTLRFRIPSAAILLPMLAASAAKLTGLIDIHVPWPLIALANVLIGWSVGFRFDRPVVRHALRLLPKMILLFAIMIALCTAAGMALGALAGVDPLTSFLATSPGGMDSMAIVALAIGGNTALVMAVQMVRYILTSLTGTATATLIAQLVGEDVPSPPEGDC